MVNNMNLKSQTLNTSVTRVRHASLQHAHSFRVCKDGLLSVPRSVMLDGIISYGGGTGKGLTLIKKGFGEYYERNHFFTSVPRTATKPLSAVTPESHQQKLVSLCQYSDKKALLAHPFSFTKVQNLFDDASYDYLYNAVSLRTMREDHDYLNISDSCACASHTDKNKALYNSLMEFLERQALLGSWISKSVKSRVNPYLLREITPYTELVDDFLENGDLYIFDMGHHLPGYNIIVYYFSHCEHDAVQYCVGTKTSGTLREALNGAFEELYQCYTFLYSSVYKESNLENKAGTGYHMAFITHNHQKTKSLIPYLDCDAPILAETVSDIDKLPIYQYEDLICDLRSLSKFVYYYHFYDEDLALHFTKILSPDFFAHLAVDKSLNLECDYAQKIGIQPGTAYLEKLPFP